MRPAPLILTALAAGAALAQGVPDDPSALRLERIEQGFEDVSPLATSLEQFNPELRQPTGFESVYRVPGTDGLLMRRSGAVYAVFERSEYASSRFGDYPVVPPGTVYSIGAPSDDLIAHMSNGPRSLLSGTHATDRRAVTPTSSLRITNRILTPANTDESLAIGTRSLMSHAPSPWLHDVERRRRVDDLFDRLTQDSSEPDDQADD